VKAECDKKGGSPRGDVVTRRVIKNQRRVQGLSFIVLISHPSKRC
jgi:hypothetical protein